MLVSSANRLADFGKVKPVFVLYAAYLVFFLFALVKSNESGVGEYLSTMACISFMVIALLQYGGAISLKRWKYLLLVFVTIFSIVLILRPQSQTTILLYLKIMVTIAFFSVFAINRQQFVKFINQTYLLYLTISILVWVGVIPNVFYEAVKLADNYADFGFVSYYILRGIEGSAATIDTYSAFVLLVNVFLNQGTKKRFYIIAAIVGVLASFRMTPFVSIFCVILLYPLYKNSKFIATAILLSIAVFFILFLKALYEDVSINMFGEDASLRLLAYGATHARSMIWVQQLDIMAEHYSFLDYIFGRFTTAEFTVPTYQLGGEETGGDSLNPHNNYLLLFFRSPFMFILFAIIFLIAQYKSYSKQTFPVVLLLFLAALTNSSIIGLGNPVYLFYIIFIMLEKKTKTYSNASQHPQLLKKIL